ncbi:hypothetical protein ACX0G9_15985 [Flavitalea flava]
METFYTILQGLQLDFIQVFISCVFFFAIGYGLGGIKGRKLTKTVQKLEKEIMDLNSELLYNNKDGKVIKENSTKENNLNRGNNLMKVS